MDDLDGAIDAAFNFDMSNITLSPGASSDIDDMSYADLFSLIQSTGGTPPSATASFTSNSEHFTVTYTVPNSSDTYKMKVAIDGLTADSSNDYGHLDGNGDNVDIFDPDTWTVDGGLSQ